MQLDLGMDVGVPAVRAVIVDVVVTGGERQLQLEHCLDGVGDLRSARLALRDVREQLMALRIAGEELRHPVRRDLTLSLGGWPCADDAEDWNMVPDLDEDPLSVIVHLGAWLDDSRTLIEVIRRLDVLDWHLRQLAELGFELWHVPRRRDESITPTLWLQRPCAASGAASGVAFALPVRAPSRNCPRADDLAGWARQLPAPLTVHAFDFHGRRVFAPRPAGDEPLDGATLNALIRLPGSQLLAAAGVDSAVQISDSGVRVTGTHSAQRLADDHPLARALQFSWDERRPLLTCW